MVSFALLIGRIPSGAIVLCALLAFIHNLWILPRWSSGKLETPTDLERGYSPGMLIYPAVLFFLSLLFFSQQIFMAIGWGAMAFGDAAAAVFGRKGKRSIPWNPDKHWRGTFAFVVLGSLLTLGLVALLPATTYRGISFSQWIPIIVLAVAAAAIVETIPRLIDDNLVVPLTAAVTSYWGYLATTHGAFFLPMGIGWGLIAVAAFGWLSALSGKIDRGGAVAGSSIALGMFLGGKWAALGILGIFFVGGTLASSLGKKRKQELGLAQEKGGKRSLKHALANGLCAGVLGLSAWIFPDQSHLLLAAMAGSLASAFGDTLSSELGNIYGKAYVNILTGKPGPRGQDGMISLEGTLIGFGGSTLLGVIFAVSYGDWTGGLLVAIGGIAGNLTDSVLGATLQPGGWLSNDTVNFLNTATGAILTYLLYALT